MRKVNVVIPIYKGNRYICNLIHMLENNWESANKTEPVEIEMVLVNDYPEEDIIIKEEWRKNISWLVVTNKSNKGIHFSRVRGALHSDGDYIVFLDQDDVISSVYIREQLRKIETYDVVICNGKNRGNLIYKNLTQIQKAIDLDEFRRHNKIISPGQVLLRRQILPKEWIENILTENGADDYFLWLLILIKKYKVTVQDKVLYWHVFTGENSSNNYRKMRNSVLEMEEKLVELGFFSDVDKRKIEENKLAFMDEEFVPFSKYLKENRYKSLLETWMGLRERKISVIAFLQKIGIKRIAIYGMGIMGRHLYYELQESSVQAECYFDQNQEIEMSKLKRIMPGERIRELDAIIVTPFMEYEQIRDDLKQCYSCEIISIETLVYNSDFELYEEN